MKHQTGGYCTMYRNSQAVNALDSEIDNILSLFQEWLETEIDCRNSSDKQASYQNLDNVIRKRTKNWSFEQKHNLLVKLCNLEEKILKFPESYSGIFNKSAKIKSKIQDKSNKQAQEVAVPFFENKKHESAAKSLHATSAPENTSNVAGSAAQ